MKGIQDTSSKTYRQLMANGLRYEVPKFQRDYSWEAEQWDDLWQDIQALLQNTESEHYMGYLVLQTSDNRLFSIIDGQQRLTTLSILVLTCLKSLQDLADKGIEPEKNIRRKENLMNSYIGYVDPVTLISDNKLKLNRNSDDYYRQHMVLLKNLPLKGINSSEKHMRECFNWYYERIKKDFTTGEQVAAFVDNIVDKLFFTVIEVTDQLNAFKVFETLNARGIQLSSADLLKNYLFSVVDATRPHGSEINELENLWSKIVAKLGDYKFEDYLRYFWNSQNKSIAKRNLFKEIKSNISTKSKVFDLLRDLLDTADLFLAIQNPEDPMWKPYPDIRKNLSLLRIFQIRQLFSLFLSALKYLKDKDLKEFARLVKISVVVSFRYNIIGGLNPNEQEEVYNRLALKIYQEGHFDPDDFYPVYVADDSFENDFSTKEFRNTSRNHKIVKYIFSELEKYLYKNDISWESDLFTVEHILPEGADESWGDFTYEEINRNVFRLGNLTLLEEELNRRAGSEKFEEKIKIYSKSNSQLTRAIVKNYHSWNEDKLASRQRELAKHAKNIWRIPELSDR